MSFLIENILKPEKKKIEIIESVRRGSDSEDERARSPHEYVVCNRPKDISNISPEFLRYQRPINCSRPPSNSLCDSENTNYTTEYSTPRKRRVLFTRKQTYELEKVFQYQQYLTISQRDYLSKKTCLTPTQVKIWFQNHRYKIKKHHKETLSEASVAANGCAQCKCQLGRCSTKVSNPTTYSYTTNKSYLPTHGYIYERKLSGEASYKSS